MNNNRRTNRKTIETNIKSLEFLIELKKRNNKMTLGDKASLERDKRLLKMQRKRLKELNRVGEKLYTKMYPHR